MKISEMTSPDFIEILSSKEPIPGGGGASALCAAIGTALGNMVGSLTVGKKKYADVEGEILDLKKRCTALQQECLELIDADGEAFLPLAKAYSLPADTEEEKAYKDEVLENCSVKAAQVPLDIMKKCCEGITLAGRFAQIGSKLAISDAGCAAAILKGALEAASLNVFINTKSMKNREYAESVNSEANDMLREGGKSAAEIFADIRAKLNPEI